MVYTFKLQKYFTFLSQALEKCNPMALFKLSYFDTGCLKKVKTEEKIQFPHNYKQHDQILKQRCVTKKSVFKGTLSNNFVT